MRPLSGTTLVVGAGGGIGAALLDKLALRADIDQIVGLHTRPFTKRRPVRPATADECAERLIGVLERLKVQDSGRFLNHDGADLPW